MSGIILTKVLVCVFYSVQLVTADSVLAFRKCHLGDDVCSTNVTIYLLKYYADTGVTALNLRAFDPLYINRMKLERPSKPPVLIEFNFKNVDIRGLGNMQNIAVSGFTRDVKRPISVNATIPAAVLRGTYDANGSIEDRVFEGKGNFSLVLKNITDTIKINARLVNKDGREYLSIEDVNLKLSQPLKVYYQFEGLVDGVALNRYLNENWLRIFVALRSSMEKAFGLIIKDIVSEVFDSRPYEDFFLP